MGAFDTDKRYNSNPYNGEQRMKSVTWILISVIFGCVFIAKRLYFKKEKERLKKGNPQMDFADVMSNVILCLLWFRFIFGPPNPAIMSVVMSIFMIMLFVGVGILLRFLWAFYVTRKLSK
jgi:hypothetical protein